MIGQQYGRTQGNNLRSLSAHSKRSKRSLQPHDSSKPNGNHYIDGAAFSKRILHYNATGDEVTGNEIIADLYALAYNVVLTFTREHASIDWDVAQDLIQDLTSSAWLKLHRYDASRGSAFNWCTKVMRNLMGDLFDKRDQHTHVVHNYFEHLQEIGAEIPQCDTDEDDWRRPAQRSHSV